MEFGPILRAMKRNKVRFGLIVLEVALTLAIVTNCVNMIKTAKKDLTHESGFDDDNIISVRSTPFEPAFKEDGYLDNELKKDEAALRAIPGVVAVSNTRFLPWQGGGSSMESRILGSKGEMLRNQVYNADEATVAALGTHLVAGRNFTTQETTSEALRMRELFKNARELGPDGTPNQKVSQDVIVSKAFADLVFKDGNALGKRLEDSDGDMYVVVGIIDKFYNPYGWPIHEYVMFFAGYARSYEGGAAFLLRTAPGRREEVQGQIERVLLASNPGRVLKVQSLLQVKELYHTRSSMVVALLSSIVGLLLFVTALGIVGLTSFSVSERTRQIGTRRALGAQKADILRYFLLENWIVTSMGLVIGVFLAFGLNIALVTGVNGTRMPAALVLAGVVLLWLAGFLATLFPALKGVRVAPAIATRNV
jgi:putative ABC transport system permease protein